MFKNKIPLLKVSLPKKKILISKLSKTLYSGNIAEGKIVYEFEKNFQKKFNYINYNVLAVNSGTAALHIAYMLCKIKKGDEIISSPVTAEPTNIAILHAGGRVRFADVNPLTGNLDPKSVEKNINKNTRAICIVHYGGYPAEVDKIKKIAKKYKLYLIEDCAHALGAKISNKFVGSFGDFSIFSFQAVKQITTIDGGILLIKNKKFYKKAKRIRWFGLTKSLARSKNRIKDLGYKYNMNNITAVIGKLQLKQINKLNSISIKNARLFEKAIKSNPNLQNSPIAKNNKSVYWLFNVLTKNSLRLIKKLNYFGIEASKVHVLNNIHPIFNSNKLNLKGCEEFYKKILHIPCGWWLKKSKRNIIINILKNFK
ncbi:DegT/DnrJ/EryC1/StrS family aminotransferase [Candidatus Fonsibacter ubiquis]|uniref:DegT/DnrJ/EryC1/StrS family aminotransferase n=1 Tax=Candidatus Fonsibacter ubiquis TaxID=1925548 RepID=UPI000C079B6B|nr:aminotransferase class V-fold PLP-dependent enzyme [Candidatus Fonsibacter ubiquis]